MDFLLPFDPKNQPQDGNDNREKKTKNEKNYEIGAYAYACVAGYEYAGIKKSEGFKLGKSGYKVINKTQSNLTEVSELASNTTISGTVTGEGGWSWGVIEAKVGFDASASHTWTTSQSTSITVKPGYWGWIDYGTISEKWAGDYYYLTSTCGKTGVKYLTVDGPKYKAKLAKAALYPY